MILSNGATCLYNCANESTVQVHFLQPILRKGGKQGADVPLLEAENNFRFTVLRTRYRDKDHSAVEVDDLLQVYNI